MGKEALIGRGLWDSYSEKVRERMNAPKHFGVFTEEDATKRGLKLVDVLHGSESCGDAVELFLLVDPVSHVIRDARFKSFGCGTAIAASDMMAELCVGKTADQVLKITNLDVERSLRDNPETPSVPGQKMHCSVMAYDVIKKAVASYKNVDIKEFEEKEIVCHCGRITRKQIEDAITFQGLKTVEEVMEATGAGTYCGSCIRPGGHEEKNVYLVDILDEILRKKQTAREVIPMEKRFADMTVPQKLKVLERALDEHVRPSLASDAGGLEIMDLQGNLLFIQYTGACAGCASAGRGTLQFVEATLKEKVDAGLTVRPYRE
ncbi:MAG: iron-sulfur cluster assembly scaffold protein [Fibrobacterota bacterium]